MAEVKVGGIAANDLPWVQTRSEAFVGVDELPKIEVGDTLMFGKSAYGIATRVDATFSNMLIVGLDGSTDDDSIDTLLIVRCPPSDEATPEDDNPLMHVLYSQREIDGYSLAVCGKVWKPTRMAVPGSNPKVCAECRAVAWEMHYQRLAKLVTRIKKKADDAIGPLVRATQVLDLIEEARPDQGASHGPVWPPEGITV